MAMQRSQIMRSYPRNLFNFIYHSKFIGQNKFRPYWTGGIQITVK